MRSPKSILWQLIRLMRPFSRQVLLALLLSVATIGSSIGLMMTSAWLISTAGLQLGITSLGVAPTAVRFFGLSRAIFRYLERLISHDVTFRLLAQLRVWFYERIEPLSPAQLKAYSSGDLMSRLVTDIDELQNLYLRVVAPPIVALIITVVMGLVFALFDPLSALVLVIFMVIAGTLLPLFTWWIGKSIGQQVVRARTLMNIHLVDSIQGLADSIAYGYAAQRANTLHTVNDDLAQRERQMARLDGLQGGISVLLVNIAAFCVLLVAVNRVDGVYLATLALGTIAAFEALTPLALATQHLGKEIESAQRVFEVIDSTPIIPEPSAPQAAPTSSMDLNLSHVSFRYAPDEPYVLSDFSLTVPYGQRILIMGESGSGKSSLVNLLMRFWDYETGQISIGSSDLKALAHEDIRQIFGVMTQRTHLFNTTIRENIRIARKEATDEDIETAAKAAYIHDFILSLPQGYDTYVGEDGSSLSGGERQRVALARILLKDSPIWLLDEITANLDPVTANSVLASILSAGKERTIIFMTHRAPLTEQSDFSQIITLQIHTNDTQTSEAPILS